MVLPNNGHATGSKTVPCAFVTAFSANLMEDLL
jgi:hypothetical protein